MSGGHGIPPPEKLDWCRLNSGVDRSEFTRSSLCKRIEECKISRVELTDARTASLAALNSEYLAVQ